MLKKTLIVSLVAFLSILVIACKNDGESTCEKLNDLCKQNQNCEEAAKKYDDEYDKATDAQKEAADTYVDCIDDADSCDQAGACLQKYVAAFGGGNVNAGTSSSGGSSSGSVTIDAGQ